MGELIFLLLIIQGTLLFGPIVLLGIIVLLVATAWCELQERWERFVDNTSGQEEHTKQTTT